MAASDVDIVNMALSHLGDAANVQSVYPSDGTAQADHANRVYAETRDWLLERFAWKFALRRATLAERADVSVDSWAYVYAEPNNCLRLLSVLPTGYTRDSQSELYETETDDDGAGLILTDAADATARFIARVTDPARFSPGFTQTLSWALASILAGPIIKGETGRAEAVRCLQAAQLMFGIATGLSASQSKRTLEFIPAHIAARGGATTPDTSYPIVGT